MDGVVIVGAGQAGFQLGTSLRQGGYTAPITLLGDEASLPYGRPPLSKGYLLGKTDAAGLELRPQTFFADQNLTVQTGEPVVSIDPAARQVVTEGGRRLAYDHLVLATGARNRPLPVPGADLPGVHQLRTLADADALKAAIDTIHHVVIIGAGFIGLEFAAVCAARGLAVTVLEGQSRILARALSPAMAEAIAATHAAAGVRIVLGAGVTAITESGGRASGVATADGQVHPADLVLIGISFVFPLP